MAGLHLVLLSVLCWLAADHEAHRRLHAHDHEVAEIHSGDFGADEVRSLEASGGPAGHEDDTGEQPPWDDCAVSLLLQGKWSFCPVPAFGVAWVAERVVVVAFGSPTPRRSRVAAALPYSCGPPLA